ncbi:MAG: hypothetical protein HZC16_02870 [Candidatus Omnitrophica bacterium]|nr:hypothetical protein [Candidatus Omnitrophota bacterium]
MHNWSVDLKKLNKNPKAAIIWKLQQSVNFGLNGKKLRKKLLIKYWDCLHLDPLRKKFLKLLLWPRKTY